MVSLDKEEASGDPNLILCRMRDQNLSRTQAINQIIEEADTAVQRFLDHERQIPALCSSLALTPIERTAVHAYTDLMRTMIRGNCDWHRTAGRYSAQAQPLVPPTLLNRARQPQ